MHSLEQIEKLVKENEELVFYSDVDIALAGEIEKLTQRAGAVKAKLRERMRTRYDAAVTNGRAGVITAAGAVLDAYKNRFGVPCKEGENFVGPIDEEVSALAVALAALQETSNVVND